MQSEYGNAEMPDTATADAEMDSSYNESGWIEQGLTSHNESELEPIMAPYNPFVVPVNGYISPILIAITLVANCAVCAVLLRPHMRSPTNILLVAIATSDMLTGQYIIGIYAE